MDQSERLQIAAAAQASASAFSTARFMEDCLAALEPILPLPH